MLSNAQQYSAILSNTQQRSAKAQQMQQLQENVWQKEPPLSMKLPDVEFQT